MIEDVIMECSIITKSGKNCQFPVSYKVKLEYEDGGEVKEDFAGYCKKHWKLVRGSYKTSDIKELRGGIIDKE